jgi:hypothetical protein
MRRLGPRSGPGHRVTGRYDNLLLDVSHLVSLEGAQAGEEPVFDRAALGFSAF